MLHGDPHDVMTRWARREVLTARKWRTDRSRHVRENPEVLLRSDEIGQHRPMRTISIETPVGVALAHLSPVDTPRGTLVLGHGAGGGIGAPDLVAVSGAAHDAGFTVVLVEQPYRVAGRRAPPRPPSLDAAWTTVIDHLRLDELGPLEGRPLVVGGRSSGARVACRTAAAVGATRVLCLAFPLQPPRRNGKPAASSRSSELDQVTVPVLMLQGDHDPFGTPPAAASRTVVIVAGDHSLKSGLAAVAAATRTWLTDATGGVAPQGDAARVDTICP